MISACITDPLAVRLRIKDSRLDAFTYPETGCKRQAAPSLEPTYCWRTISVNPGLESRRQRKLPRCWRDRRWWMEATGRVVGGRIAGCMRTSHPHSEDPKKNLSAKL